MFEPLFWFLPKWEIMNADFFRCTCANPISGSWFEFIEPWNVEIGFGFRTIKSGDRGPLFTCSFL